MRNVFLKLTLIEIQLVFPASFPSEIYAEAALMASSIDTNGKQNCLAHEIIAAE